MDIIFGASTSIMKQTVQLYLHYKERERERDRRLWVIIRLDRHREPPIEQFPRDTGGSRQCAGIRTNPGHD